MENTLQPSDYIRPKEAARYLNVSPRTIARWIACNRIPYIRMGRRMILLRKSSLDRAMDKLTIRSYGDIREEQERSRRNRW